MPVSIRGRLGFLFAGVLLSLALAAGCGDDGDDGSNGQASPTVSFAGTVGEGLSPLAAVGTVLNFAGLDGQLLNLDRPAECPLEDVLETPGVNSRYRIGQFCVTFINFSPAEGGVAVVENKEAGGIWEFELTVDDVTWKVETIEKVSDGNS